jgi:O-antigen ligase
MKVILPLVLSVIANLTSAFFSVDFGIASFYMAVTFYLLLLFWFVAAVVARHGPAIVEWMARGYVCAAAIAATIGLLARFRLIPMSQMFFRDASGLRIKSTFKDPNVFGPFLVAAAILLLASLVHSRRMRPRDGLLLVLCALGILLSFSRGAWLHFGVSLGVFAAAHLLILRSAQARRRLLFSAAGVAIVLVPLLGWLLTSPDLGEYFGKRLSFQSYDSERFGSQARALRVGLEYPLGLGPGQWLDWRFQLSPHNVYLRVCAENGFLGLLAFLLVVGVSVSQAVGGILARGAGANLHVAALSIVAGVLVESLVIDTLHWRHFWVFLALPIGLRAWERARSPRGAACAGGSA